MIEGKHIYTVSEITKGIKTILEDSFPAVWVEGEVSNFNHHSSGHMYFTLKDEQSQLRVVVFREANQNIKFEIEDGLHLICFGRIGVYTKSGLYQLYAEVLEPKGLGALQLAFEQLKEKLRKEGLFDPSHKRPIPLLPTRIGVVTSPTGAAVRDILNILERRFSNIEVLINPVKVQGDGAGDQIANAIREFNNLEVLTDNLLFRPDVLIVGRGGGSLEDLWPFNEEIVARAIYDSEIPIISAVGHEIDTTIADFVADLRAPTPSAAAELVIPKKEELVAKIDALLGRFESAMVNKLNLLNNRLESLKESYVFERPMSLLQQSQQDLDMLAKILTVTLDHILEMHNERCKNCVSKLEALSPLSILSRGYSISLQLPYRCLIKDARMLRRGDRVETRVEKGSFVSRVEEIKSG